MQTATQYAHAAYMKKNEEIQKIQKALISKEKTNSTPLEDYDKDFCNYESKFDAEVCMLYILENNISVFIKNSHIKNFEFCEYLPHFLKCTSV